MATKTAKRERRENLVSMACEKEIEILDSIAEPYIM
jgi:hypothetical protein